MHKTKSIVFVALLAFGFVFASLPVAFASHTDIPVGTAWSMINNPLLTNIVILDVRNQSEVDAVGYIPMSILIPLWQMQQRIGELSAYKDNEIIVYCRTGGRSNNASIILDANNFTKVYDMSGGIEGWIAAGYPVAKGTLQGSYRDWKVLLNAGRIYIISPYTVAGRSLIQQVGMWDADYYGSLGKTVVDAAKPAIDECISGSGFTVSFNEAVFSWRARFGPIGAWNNLPIPQNVPTSYNYTLAGNALYTYIGPLSPARPGTEVNGSSTVYVYDANAGVWVQNEVAVVYTSSQSPFLPVTLYRRGYLAFDGTPGADTFVHGVMYQWGFVYGYDEATVKGTYTNATWDSTMSAWHIGFAIYLWDTASQAYDTGAPYDNPSFPSPMIEPVPASNFNPRGL